MHQSNPEKGAFDTTSVVQTVVQTARHVVCVCNISSVCHSFNVIVLDKGASVLQWDNYGTYA